MKNNIGIENIALVRDAKPAIAAADAASGNASPPLATCSVEAIMIFWFGQIINQTLVNIKMAVVVER